MLPDIVVLHIANDLWHLFECFVLAEEELLPTVGISPVRNQSYSGGRYANGATLAP